MPNTDDLPFPPALGGPIPVSADVSFRDEGSIRVVFVRGVPLHRYTREDRVTESVMVATLAEAELARPSELQALGRSRASIHRDRVKLRAGGVAALVPSKRGPKGPSKTSGGIAEAARRLRDEQGLTRPAIARSLGLSVRSIDRVLKGSDTKGRSSAAQGQLPLGEPAVASCGAPAAVPPQAPAATEKETAAPSPACEPSPAPEGPLLAPSGPPLGDGVAPDRSVDRGLAATGAIAEAAVELRAGENLRFLGVLLALPALASLGLLDAFRETYGSLRPAFYGLRATVLTLFHMALLRIRSVEQLKGVTPATLGRLLGLDRAPEVKTLRRKLVELALRSKAADLIRALARRWAALDSEATGILYVDGHVRVYHGKHSLPKAHVAQLRLSVPATTDYWVNDRDGDPLFLVTAPANRGMVAMLPDLVREIRSTVGERRVTVVFDRGGYSPALFQRLSEHCDVLTYWKGDVEPIPLDRFVEEELRIDGRVERYKLAERLVTLGGFEMRHVAVLRPDGKQTPILTTRRDWRRAYVAYRMFSRWRQENYFRYMGEEFSLDALLEHAVEPDDPKRLVPNPERKRVGELRAKARAEVSALERAYGRALDENVEVRRPTARGVKIANGKTGRALRAAREKAAALHEQWRALPERVPLDTLRPADEIVRLAPERKLVVDAVRSTAYRAESALLAILSDTSFTRDQDEGRAFLQDAFQLSGDLDIAADGAITVTLAHMSAPRMTRALAEICERLNATATRFPGTSSKITYRVRGEDCLVPKEG